MSIILARYKVTGKQCRGIFQQLIHPSIIVITVVIDTVLRLCTDPFLAR